MTSEQDRVMKKISKILSELEPETAAGVARQVADSYAAAASPEEPADAEPAETETQQPEDDSFKPAFLRTQHRMTIGREILEREKEPDK